MSLIGNITVTHVVALAGGLLIGWGLFVWKLRRQKDAINRQREQVLDDARKEGEALIREFKIKANEEALKIREQTEAAFTERRRRLEEQEKRLIQKEEKLNFKSEGLLARENKLQDQRKRVEKKSELLEEEKERLRKLAEKRHEELARIAHFSAADARQIILKEVEEEAAREANALSHRIIEEARTRAEDKARRILSTAIQRYAGEHTFETTTATITLPGDEIKGRIIGREGRNIRAFEAATGITVLIDDTPGAVVLSGFDPVRREIAREAMHRLITDGRIHPTRIEEVVEKARADIEQHVQSAGEDAVLKLGLPPLHPEITKVLGRLRFRLSYSQNVLDHSVEVAHLCGLMAAELGIDVADAKRAGLLHDIGKAINHEVEGAHAKVGAEFIQRFGLSEQVVNGVASHHDEVEHIGPLGILVGAADAISAARPGARTETLTTYLKRLENLERIGNSFEGVEKCYAVHAGRELRVMIQSEVLKDEEAFSLARKLSRKIEEELQYPGQIRVTVIRETRCVEYAK